MTENITRDADALRQLYHNQNKTLAEIGEIAGRSRSQVAYWMDKHGINRRDAPADKTATVYLGTVGDGYEAWQTNACGERAQVYVHKLTAVAEYGFDAVAGGDVHHENGIKWDNRPSNLEPMDPGQHLRMHVQEQERDESGEFVDG